MATHNYTQSPVELPPNRSMQKTFVPSQYIYTSLATPYLIEIMSLWHVLLPGLHAKQPYVEEVQEAY